MAEIKHATDANFEELVLHNDKPVVVDFWATRSRQAMNQTPAANKSPRILHVRTPVPPGFQTSRASTD